MIDHRENVSIDDIKEEMYYTVPQICGMLKKDRSTVVRWCNNWRLRHKSVWTKQRKIRIIKWEHINDFINN